MTQRTISTFCFSVILAACNCYGVVTPYISASSTASLVEDGVHAGWYLYEIEFEWVFNGTAAGLSHWDIILKPGCADEDHLFAFDTPAGFSTSESFPSQADALGWTGYFEQSGDGSIPGVSGPIIKYDEPFFPDTDEPGQSGYGTFTFYANIIPESGTYENTIVSKGGVGVGVVYGTLNGDWPSCTTIPEPGMLVTVGIGWFYMRKYPDKS